MTIALAVATVLGLLAALHVFWAFGGRWGADKAVPRIGGRAAFSPSPAACLFVAVGLAGAAADALLAGNVLVWTALGSFPRGMAIALGLLFIGRSIGEMRLIGFFKRVKGTPFAKWDTWLFSPLCVLIGTAFIALWAR